MSAETQEIPIIYSAPDDARSRMMLNDGLLEAVCYGYGWNTSSLPFVLENKAIMLRGLAQRLDLSGIDELSVGQNRAFMAITDLENADKCMPEIAADLGIREAYFQKVRRKIYGHLGVRGPNSRAKAVVMRTIHERKLAHKFAQAKQAQDLAS